jgi:hypothetical protein
MATVLAMLLLAFGPTHALGGYGMRLQVPSGWHGHVSQGIVAAATFPIPKDDNGFGPATARRVRSNDVLLLLSEYEALPGEHLPCLPQTHAPALRMADLGKAVRHPNLALANFCLSSRHFTLFGQAGTNTLHPATLAQIDHRLRLLHGRHDLAWTPLCALLPRARKPARARCGLHREPRRALDSPASPTACLVTLPASDTGPVSDP